MVGLLDIAPLTKTVSVGGAEVTVFGVSAEGIAALLMKFPELRKLMSGMDLEISPEDLVSMVPTAISAIIAIGCGYLDNAEAVEVARKLPADQQIDLLKAIFELTMPKGARPFFAKLMDTAGALDASVKTAVTKSLQQSSDLSETGTG